MVEEESVIGDDFYRKFYFYSLGWGEGIWSGKGGTENGRTGVGEMENLGIDFYFACVNILVSCLVKMLLECPAKRSVKSVVSLF